jgi:hypothetical protein
MRKRIRYLHGSRRKTTEYCHLGCCPHFQAQEHIKWQNEYQDVRQNRETRNCNVKFDFDAFRIWVTGMIPYRRYGKALEDNDKENSNSLQRSKCN